MRILLVVGSYYPELQFGGSTQKIYELSLGLSARGHDVEVMTFHSDRTVPHPPVDVQGVAVEYMPWVGRGSWRVPLRLRNLRRAVRRSDVVHCFGLYSLLCGEAALCARRAGRPYFVEPLGMYVPRARRLLAKKIYNALFSSWMLRGAAGVIATSAREYDELSSAVSPGRLTLRRDGIDPQPFASPVGAGLFRRRFGLRDGERVVLFVGRISRLKNLEQLILAFGKAALDKTRLVLVGPMDEPDYTARLRALLSETGLGEKVLLTGPLYEADKLPAFAAADLFVLPSLYESYGVAAAEAVAAGVPVLLTEECGIAPVIHRRAGLAVPLGVESLAAALRTLLDDSTEREALVRERDKVVQELTWEEPLTRLEALYAKALRRREGRPVPGASGTHVPGEANE
jgi:glycosyltransferase involved in cell wall biosynthesis